MWINQNRRRQQILITFSRRALFESVLKKQQMSANPLIDAIHAGDLRESVKLPVGENINEWYAKHVSCFYQQLSMIFPMIAEFCTPENCPQMTAGGGFKYLWQENERQKPIALSAPVYINTLLDWVKRQLEDESIFPTALGAPFPANFELVVRNIMKRLFRIYAHAYYPHQENFRSLGATAHLNTSFRHFVLFQNQFALVDPDQLDPLRDVIDAIVRQ
jgi:MOB kinase activator 1